jgi:hypothetical protein
VIGELQPLGVVRDETGEDEHAQRADHERSQDHACGGEPDDTASEILKSRQGHQGRSPEPVRRLQR